jgi:hypothetical protein
MAKTVNSVEWHKENLKCRKEYFDRQLVILKRLEKETTRMGEQIAFHDYQIKEAKRMKKDKFDADRFRVTKEE